MQQWYYVQDGKQQGPVLLEKLRELARDGKLETTDLVWNAEMRDWTPAGEIDGIFSSRPAETSEAPEAGSPGNTDSTPPSSGPLSEIEPGSEALNISVIFNRTIELTKRNINNLLLLGLIIIAISTALTILTSIGQTGSSPFLNPSEIFSQKAPAKALEAVEIFRISASIIIQQVAGLFLTLGLYRCCLKMISGRPVQLNMLFGEGRLLLRALGAFVIMVILISIGFILIIIPGIYIALRLSQVLPAIVDRNMTISEAIEYSAKLTKGNLMNLLFLWLIIGILAVAVILMTCGIGQIITTPVIGLATMLIYRFFQYGHNATVDKPGTDIPVLNDLPE